MNGFYNQDDQDARPVHALAMTPEQAYHAFADIIYTSYTPAEELSATRVQMTEAIKHTQYLLWLHSEPSREEIDEAMRTLSGTDTKP